MALINCPECGKEISDKVTSCPHCGFPFQIQKDDKTVQSNGNTLKKYGMIIAAGLSIILISIFLLNYSNQIKEQKILTEYKTKVNEVLTIMLNSEVKAEEMINLTGEVWNNAIMKKSNPRTDLYTKNKVHNYWEDFNSALSNLYLSEHGKQIDYILSNYKTDLEKLVKELQIPPTSFEKVYEAVLETFNKWNSVISTALKPSGSYKTYTETSKQKIDSFFSSFDKIEPLMPKSKTE